MNIFLKALYEVWIRRGPNNVELVYFFAVPIAKDNSNNKNMHVSKGPKEPIHKCLTCLLFQCATSIKTSLDKRETALNIGWWNIEKEA